MTSGAPRTRQSPPTPDPFPTGEGRNALRGPRSPSPTRPRRRLRRRIYWPAERLLTVADLHLEKGSAFAARGVLLPPYDTAATLGRLAHLIERYDPRVVVALGDSFHDGGGFARMDGASRAAFAGLAARPPLGLDRRQSRSRSGRPHGRRFCRRTGARAAGVPSRAVTRRVPRRDRRPSASGGADRRAAAGP